MERVSRKVVIVDQLSEAVVTVHATHLGHALGLGAFVALFRMRGALEASRHAARGGSGKAKGITLTVQSSHAHHVTSYFVSAYCFLGLESVPPPL